MGDKRSSPTFLKPNHFIMYKDQTQIQITIDNDQFVGFTHPQVIDYFKTDVAPALIEYVSGTVRCYDDGKGDKGDKGNGNKGGGVKWDFSIDGKVDNKGNASAGAKFTIGGSF